VSDLDMVSCDWCGKHVAERDLDSVGVAGKFCSPGCSLHGANAHLAELAARRSAALGPQQLTLDVHLPKPQRWDRPKASPPATSSAPLYPPAPPAPELTPEDAAAYDEGLQLLKRAVKGGAGVALLALLTACADSSTLWVVVDARAPSWVTPATLAAVDWWQYHAPDAFVVVDEDAGDVVVRMDVDNEYEHTANAPPGEVVLDQRLDQRSDLTRKCVIAHELGHQLGMTHHGTDEDFDGPGLMGFPQTVDVAGAFVSDDSAVDCAWSDLDAAELERVRGAR
jgi:hypothetical protein